METITRLQKLPLEQKVLFSKRRIQKFYEARKGAVSVSFSGGKDSTVMLHLVRSLYPEVPAVFVNTGLEYPEIVEFVKTVPNCEIIKPKMTFKEVLDKYGFPVPSKEQAYYIRQARHTKSAYLRDKRINGHPGKANKVGKIAEKWKFLLDAPFEVSEQCCDVMKKRPSKQYMKRTGRAPYIGSMAVESRQRLCNLMLRGCMILEGRNAQATPLAFWNDEDIWEYIRTRGLDYCRVYDKGLLRTGCMFCMFGFFSEDPEHGRFKIMAEFHPKQYKYCMENLGLRKVIDYCHDHLGCGRDKNQIDLF